MKKKSIFTLLCAVLMFMCRTASVMAQVDSTNYPTIIYEISPDGVITYPSNPNGRILGLGDSMTANPPPDWSMAPSANKINGVYIFSSDGTIMLCPIPITKRDTTDEVFFGVVGDCRITKDVSTGNKGALIITPQPKMFPTVMFRFEYRKTRYAIELTGPCFLICSDGRAIIKNGELIIK